MAFRAGSVRGKDATPHAALNCDNAHDLPAEPIAVNDRAPATTARNARPKITANWWRTPGDAADQPPWPASPGTVLGNKIVPATPEPDRPMAASAG